MKAALLSDRGVVKVTGDEARSFLHGLVSADMLGLRPGAARFCALLTPQGKIIADFIATEAPAKDDGGFFLDVAGERAKALVDKLNLYKLRSRVMGEWHMIHMLSAIVVIGLAVSVATAQQNPIAARKALMKDNGDQAKIGAAMAKGEAPFDLARARKIFATFENTAVKAPALFPENSIDEATADDPYSASPDIWK